LQKKRWKMMICSYILLFVLLCQGSGLAWAAPRTLVEQVDHAMGRPPSGSSTGFPMLPGDDEFFIAISNEFGQHICDGKSCLSSTSQSET
jgi:hypothetical protein